MKAPEKIYLDPSDRAGEEYDAEWSVIPVIEGGVEYIRTDAFIEKAADWLKEIFFEYENLTDYNPTEDFKSYMRGE